jgi:hypothetical protein
VAVCHGGYTFSFVSPRSETPSRLGVAWSSAMDDASARAAFCVGLN